MLPKALETLAGVLARKGVFKKRSWHEGAVLLLVWAIIALTALLDYKKSQQEQVSKLDESQNKMMFTGNIGAIVNL